jgi:hypothetical protein
MLSTLQIKNVDKRRVTAVLNFCLTTKSSMDKGAYHTVRVYACHIELFKGTVSQVF